MTRSGSSCHRRFGLLDRLVEERHKGAERILVHMLDDTELDDEEEDHGTLSGHRAILLTGRVDEHLGFLRELHLYGNLHRCFLRHLEPLDKRDIVKDCRRVGLRELREQVVLEPREGNLELVLLAYELLLLLFKLRFLDVHDHGKDLVLETLRRHDEIHNRALREKLRPVMRVRKLRLDVQLELRVVVNLFASELDDERVAPAADDRPGEEWLEDCFDFLADSLNEEIHTHLDCTLDLIEPLVLRELDYLKRVCEPLLDPGDTLQLRIDHQGPPVARRDDTRVLDGDTIGRQTLVHPLRDRSLIRENLERIDSFRVRDRALLDVLQPLHGQAIAETGIEGRDVANERRREEAVANERRPFDLQIFDCSLPPDIFVRQAVDKAIRKRQLRLAGSGLGLDALFLRDRCVFLLVEPGHHRLYGGHLF